MIIFEPQEIFHFYVRFKDNISFVAFRLIFSLKISLVVHFSPNPTLLPFIPLRSTIHSTLASAFAFHYSLLDRMGRRPSTVLYNQTAAQNGWAPGPVRGGTVYSKRTTSLVTRTKRTRRRPWISGKYGCPALTALLAWELQPPGLLMKAAQNND
jgi:hypothetical protein